jgi:hypothetical protein
VAPRPKPLQALRFSFRLNPHLSVTIFLSLKNRDFPTRSGWAVVDFAGAPPEFFTEGNEANEGGQKEGLPLIALFFVTFVTFCKKSAIPRRLTRSHQSKAR